MQFTEPLFYFYFLPLALVLHRLALFFQKGSAYPTSARFAIFTLTLFFYGVRHPWWIVPFFVSIAFDFLWSTLLVRVADTRSRRLILVCSVVQNLGLLFYFKYGGHFTRAGIAVLPPAISFYTFESLSFVIDVYRGVVRPPKRAVDFFAFIGMFPRFIAGPIVRYKEMAEQFDHYPGVRLEEGLTLFFVGFFVKCVLGDSFGVFTQYAFDREGESIEFFAAWIGTLAYTFQLYFDFAGYSTMAIGLGKCIGFDFPRNFRQPYLARSLRDFWRRWHITLSDWLRDYVYLPLGGSAGGRWRSAGNLFVTMLLCGIWHGAGVTFLVWGAWHGGFLCLERFMNRRANGWASIQRVLTFPTVMLGWVFFRSSNLHEARKVFSGLFHPFRDPLHFNPEGVRSNLLAATFCVVGVIYCFFVEAKLKLEYGARETALPIWGRATAFILFVASVIVALSGSRLPFIYFRF